MSEDLHKVIFDLGEVDGRGLDGKGGVRFLLSVSRLQARSNDLIISISNHLQRSRGQVNKHRNMKDRRRKEPETKAIVGNFLREKFI